MRPSIAALRMIYRHYFFNVFHKNKVKVLHKDLQCLWVLTCRMMHTLSDNLENNGEIETLIKELEQTIGILISSNEITIRIINNPENKNRGETDRKMIEQMAMDYNCLIIETARKLDDIRCRAMEGRISEDDMSFLKDWNCWPLVTDECAKVFLTEAFMKKSIKQIQTLAPKKG